MKVITDLKFAHDWPYVIVTIVKQEVIVDDSGIVTGFGDPEVEQVTVGPQ